VAFHGRKAVPKSRRAQIPLTHMKRIILGVLICSVLHSARAVNFDFETAPYGVFPLVTATNDGLTLEVTSPGGWVFVNLPGPTSMGIASVFGSNTPVATLGEYAPLKFSFSAPVSSATFLFGDAGGDEDSPVYISAFTISGVLISTIFETHPAGFATGKSAVWSGGDAGYFVVGTSAGFNPNSLAWEVINVSRAGNVPDHMSSLGVFVLALACVGIFRRLA
jgi:hypothetical protein